MFLHSNERISSLRIPVLSAVITIGFKWDRQALIRLRHSSFDKYLNCFASHGDPLPDVPKHKGNIGINARVTEYVNANLNAFISGSRIREQEDSRDDSPGYALLNLTPLLRISLKRCILKRQWTICWIRNMMIHHRSTLYPHIFLDPAGHFSLNQGMIFSWKLIVITSP